ncbi:MAG: hypothetical protein U0W65_11625 [Bacteroidia bacterium]
MEFKLLFSVSNYSFLQVDESEKTLLEDHFSESRPAQIYFILAKNRVKINNKYVSFDEKQIELEFKIQEKDDYFSEKIQWNHPYKDLKKLEVISDYPYCDFKVVDEEGSPLIIGKSAYFLEQFHEQVNQKEFLDYEVLYIGQSVSVKDVVPVADRTNPHSTLKNILAQYGRLHPDKEIFLLFAAIKQDAALYIPQNRKLSDAKKFAKGLVDFYGTKSQPNIKQQITLCEASLINYFKPHFNDKFKDHPPSKKHSSFRDLHKLNLGKVQVTVDLNFAPRLFSTSAERLSKHYFEYDL